MCTLCGKLAIQWLMSRPETFMNVSALCTMCQMN